MSETTTVWATARVPQPAERPQWPPAIHPKPTETDPPIYRATVEAQAARRQRRARRLGVAA